METFEKPILGMDWIRVKNKINLGNIIQGMNQPWIIQVILRV